MICYIKENSLIAKVAARKLKADAVAIVIGKTIHLHNADRNKFLSDSRWVRHELAHVRQFKQHGFVPFVIKYLWESLINGYRNNKYEVEARAFENDHSLDETIRVKN